MWSLADWRTSCPGTSWPPVAIGSSRRSLHWLPEPYADLEGERVSRRFKTLANLLECEPEIRMSAPVQMVAS